MRKIILTIVVLATCLHLSAQNRVSFGTIVNQTIDITVLKQGMFKGGYEHTLTEHLTMGFGFGYLLDVTEIFEDDFGVTYSTYKQGNTTTDYNFKYPVFMLEYQSRYFLKPTNDGVFIGTTIGFKRYTEKVRISDSYSGFGTYLESGTYKETFTVIPVGLQLGIRTNGVNFGTDFFAGIMINTNSAAANERIYPTEAYAPSLKLPYPDVNLICLQFGIVLNAGWK